MALILHVSQLAMLPLAIPKVEEAVTRHPAHRMRSEFITDPVFLEVKRQLIQELQETMKLVGVTRYGLAKLLHIEPSAVTQSLAKDRGIQLTTLVRMAHVLGCDVEVNLIRRSRFQEAAPADV